MDVRVCEVFGVGIHMRRKFRVPAGVAPSRKKNGVVGFRGFLRMRWFWLEQIGVQGIVSYMVWVVADDGLSNFLQMRMV